MLRKMALAEAPVVRRGTRTAGRARRIALGCGLTAVTTAALVTGTAISADAATRDFSCSAGGFTGTIRANYTVLGGSVTMLWTYRINKGSNSGGNHGNVNLTDEDVTPVRNFDVGDSGVQDNRFHGFRNGIEYNRPRRIGGAGGFTFRFIFDKSNAGDPRCQKTISSGSF